MFQTKQKYHNEETEKEILEKGFSVYSYISLDELLLTVRKDYLEILSKINIPFWIIAISIWVISFLSGSFIVLPLFLSISYLIIFIILFFKLIFKTYYFLLLRWVVYTKKWIILWDMLYNYTDTKNLDIKLVYYEKIFLEYLWGESRMWEYIDSKKKDLVSLNGKQKYLKKAWKILESASKWWDNSDAIWKLIIPALLSFVLYVIFMYVFYYIWYFVWILFVKIYSVFIRMYLSLQNSKELQIKNKTEKIDMNIKKMMKIYDLLHLKFSEFRWWEISDISWFTAKNFDSFYTEIFTIFNEKKYLEKVISSSVYKNFIDFWIFEKYLKKSFNKPVASMIELLESQKKLADKQLIELEKTNANLPELEGRMTMKKIIIENNLNMLISNIQKLQQTKI